MLNYNEMISSSLMLVDQSSWTLIQFISLLYWRKHMYRRYTPVSSFVFLWCPVTLSSVCLPVGEEHSYAHTTYLSVSCFLDTFRKIAKSDCYIVVSVRVEQLGSPRTDFHEIWYLRIFRKYIGEIQDSLKYDKNNEYFTWQHTICMIISRSILPRMRNFSDRIVEKIKTHILCSITLFPTIVPLMRQYG